MPPFPVLALLAGRLVGLGLACGLNLYATIALAGLVSRFGWIELPPGLVGLEQAILIAGAAVLFLTEFIVATIPWVDTIWEAVHTVVRPLAAFGLGLLALEGAPWPLRIAGGMIGAIAAFAAHAAKVGLRFLVATRRPIRILISTVEDLAAVALAIAALVFPAAALAAVAIFAVILALVGPQLWRATDFAGRAAVGRVRGFFGSRDWHPAAAMPAGFRALVDPTELGQPEPRVVRAALSCRQLGAWRNGWLVLDAGLATFVHRHWLRPRRIHLSRPGDVTLHHQLLADVVRWKHDDVDFTLHLLKDGPPAEITVRALQQVSPDPPPA